MSEVKPTYDYEIDLFEVFVTIWNGKWKIIITTFVAAVIGVSFSVVKPNSFKISVPIQSNQSISITYTSLNELLMDEGLSYEVNRDSIFEIFVSEFNDYEEIIDALSTSEFVQKSIKDLDDDDKQKALIGFAKSFVLNAPSTEKVNNTMSFVWHDDLEGVRLLNDAIRQTLLKTKSILIDHINNLAEHIDFRNARELEKLRNELSLIKQNQINIEKQRIQYLLEQSAIAKELGIETSGIDLNALSQSSQNSIFLGSNSFDIPFYLRGFKAIDKEIALIQSRTREEQMLAAEGYIQTKEEIASIEEDLSSSQLRDALEALTSDNPYDWVEFDLTIADVVSQKKSMQYVVLSLVLGGVVGMIYVLISNAILNRKERFTKT